MHTDELLQTIQDEARDASLTDAEHSALRETIIAFQENHPLPSVRKWNFGRHLQHRKTNESFLFTLALRPMAIALALLLLFGGGTSYAAEQSLPGDILYPVKVSVNEPFRGLFAVGNEAEANWQAQIVERRLNEAVTLASENKLSQAAIKSLAVNIQEHTKQANEKAVQLEDSGNSTAATNIRSDLEASLNAHAATIARFAVSTKTTAAASNTINADPLNDKETSNDKVPSDTDKTEQNDDSAHTAIIATLNNEANTIATAQQKGFAKFATDGNGQQLQVAAKKQFEKATGEIAKAKEAISKVNLSGELKSKIVDILTFASTKLTNGATQLDEQHFAEAFNTLQESISTAKEIELTARLGKSIHSFFSSPDDNSEMESTTSSDTENAEDTEMQQGQQKIDTQGESEAKIEKQDNETEDTEIEDSKMNDQKEIPTQDDGANSTEKESTDETAGTNASASGTLHLDF
ncbi:hypothetical protein COV04_01360 [Candidatus Uhrbacteria bacterium CG10_big_fil_rev_8_21_14_0_10_48_11]|uniref:DUF5667 domain-containing protein n=1 Tax=Candidatus Uhrbacteria bacterium CG10_big_fil_rev_8_21_14_0_10_48_11 TaxID=1975037 RepID=A0A2M8LFD4_9BACT|nr:MAG: hypothetical protein COV04_01360 [Candidatus Uhrbacteria bacterium CG10_big_fil_rev_8_21_14_0_10_48_11]